MLDREAPTKGVDQGIRLAIKTSPGNRREILLALEEFRRRVLSEPGCVACDVLEDVSEHNRVVWMEWWFDREQVDRVVTRPRFRALLGAVKLLGTVESLQWLSRQPFPNELCAGTAELPANGASP